MHTARIISIVDDDELVRKATSSLVRSLGWETFVFASAEAFLESTQIGEMTCLITDERMPGMSGTELHARLRERGLVLPVIFVTAYPTAALREKVMTSGALALLAKPVNPIAIAQCLERLTGPT